MYWQVSWKGALHMSSQATEQACEQSGTVVEVSAGAKCWLNQREEHGIFCATLHAAFLRFVSGLVSFMEYYTMNGFPWIDSG